jgi:hypothetical protein
LSNCSFSPPSRPTVLPSGLSLHQDNQLRGQFHHKRGEHDEDQRYCSFDLEFIEIEEQEGDRITNLVLLLIEALVQYQTNVNDLANHIKLLRLDKERRDFLQEVSLD